MDDYLLFYVVCAYIYIFGLTLNAMMCNHIRKNPNKKYNKITKHSRFYSADCVVLFNYNIRKTMWSNYQ